MLCLHQKCVTITYTQKSRKHLLTMIKNNVISFEIFECAVDVGTPKCLAERKWNE